jgi:sigma-B regulation protein RsbU (phosphoserine phosphatase)
LMRASVPAVPVEMPRDRLDDLLAVTEVGLSSLAVEDLLVELLNRVRDILDSDTAAVLLIDEGGHDLVARAACGIEEEVHQGVRVPVGIGFAGAIAASKRAVSLDRVDSTTVANPILYEKGIQVMLGVPLLSADKVIGVLHVGRLEHHPFTADDAELLGVVAERVSGAVQSHQLAVERAAAMLMERSLLPPSLPAPPGVEFAARYVAREARLVGGDWYDVFTLPSGVLWVVMGDVAGHGLGAAVVMGRVRSALRAYALENHPPDEVLRLVDHKVAHFEVGTLVTLACAASSPPYDHFDLVTAGHPAPILAAPGSPAKLIEMEVLPPLGIGSGLRRPATTVTLQTGAMLVFYTDGLVERRYEDLDVYLSRLCATVSADHPETVCANVMRAMIGFNAPEDDVAVLALRRIAAAS